MGNYISCTLSSHHSGKHSNGAKVILPNGEIHHQFDGFSIKAAELMFEMPNHFLVNSRSLHIGRRFSALNADEDLEMGNVYVMFPMKRLNSIVTGSDLGALMVIVANSSANNKGKVIRGVMPELEEEMEDYVYNIKESEGPRLNLDDIEDVLGPEFQHRMSMCRSRKPLLETITEEPNCSR